MFNIRSSREPLTTANMATADSTANVTTANVTTVNVLGLGFGMG